MWRKHKTAREAQRVEIQADSAEAQRQRDCALADLEEIRSRRPLVEHLSTSLAERTPKNHFIETLNMHLKGTR